MATKPMHNSFHPPVALCRWLAAVVLVIAAATSLGCSGPMARGLAGSRNDKRLASAVADKSIPSAAEVGLSAASQPAKAAKQADETLVADDPLPTEDQP
jgi:hypothetical protein